MNAVEAYWKTRRIRWSQRTHEQWALLAEKADAAIIELEEKLSDLKCDIMENPHTDREDELLAELAAARSVIEAGPYGYDMWKRLSSLAASENRKQQELLTVHAKLIALKAQSCATCKFWTPYSFQEASGPREGTCAGPTYIEEPAEDFYCKSWEVKT